MTSKHRRKPRPHGRGQGGRRRGEITEQCPLTGKVGFDSRKAARRIADSHHAGQQLRQYQCDPVDQGGCGGWHNGSLPSFVRRGEAPKQALIAARRHHAAGGQQ